MFRGIVGGLSVSVSLNTIDVKKVTTIILTCLLIYFALGDIYLYNLIQGSTGILPLGELNGTSPCYPSPFCHVDMKGLLLDLPNFYIHHPLSAILHEVLDFKTTFWFISANLITIAHVLLALVSAKCVANDSLTHRRIGVLFFALRNFLDAFDGTVARARRPPIDAFHNVGTLGYYIDGLADGMGCVFLYLACVIYLVRHPARGRQVQYSPLNLVVIGKGGHDGQGVENDNELWEPTTPTGPSSSSPRCGNRAHCFLPVMFGFQSIVCSISWNRYIALYTKIIEDPAGSSGKPAFQSHVIKSNMMWMVIILWRIFNVHSMVEMLLAAIFFDKMLEFFRFVQCIGFIPILGAVCLSEMHLNDIELYLNAPFE